MSRKRVTLWTIRLTLLVAATVGALCVGEVAHAATPADSHCVEGRCGAQVACHQPVALHLPTIPPVPLAGIPASTDLDPAPSPSGRLEAAAGPEAPPSRRAAPLVPRSPPSA